MNYLVISDELILNDLSPELRKTYDHYTEGLKSRTEFQKLLSKLNSNRISTEWYNEKAAELAKPIKGLSYEIQKGQRGVFRLRPTINGKRKTIGQSKCFDEACGFMSEYIKAQMEIS